MLTKEDIARLADKMETLTSITPISLNATLDRMMGMVNGGLGYEEALDLLIDEFSSLNATIKEE